MMTGVLLASEGKLEDLYDDGFSFYRATNPIGGEKYLIGLACVEAVQLVEREKLMQGPQKVFMPGSGKLN